jgi:hypothetical protein
MPFLHWFKRKPEQTKHEDKPFLVEKLAPKEAKTPETVVTNLRQETGTGTSLDKQSADLQSIAPNPVVEPEGSATNLPPAAPHLSVPIGAFYEKLPAHLLAPEKPDLTRSVQIAEEDVALDRETREATLPLSILSLSCPEIFVRAVDSSDDVPITFPLHLLKELEKPVDEESIRVGEAEEQLPTAAATPTAIVETGEVPSGADQEIRLQLQPILSDFPPQLEPPSIQSLLGTEAEIALPLHLIQSQLVHGRVVVPGRIFYEALPNDLKPHFAAIDPGAEIPIPLREIFLRLPPEAIKLREDQEVDPLEETIPTPFSAQAEEDTQRFVEAPSREAPSGEAPSGETPPANEMPPPKEESPKVVVESDSKRLQAIFMTDEPLDLAKTIHKIAELPGLRSCILSTVDGIKLMGSFADPGQEKLVSALLPELFQGTRSKLEALEADPLETITLYFGLHQLSTFVQGKLCLTVLHDNRPFKPGVREKIRAVIQELAALSASEQVL